MLELQVSQPLPQQSPELVQLGFLGSFDGMQQTSTSLLSSTQASGISHWPLLVQVPPSVPTPASQKPWPQVLEEHCEPAVQASPSEVRHTPFVQDPLAQSTSPVQPPTPSWPRQMPALQRPLQHSVLSAQVSPSSSQAHEPSPCGPQHVLFPLASVVQGPRQQLFGLAVQSVAPNASPPVLFWQQTNADPAGSLHNSVVQQLSHPEPLIIAVQSSAGVPENVVPGLQLAPVPYEPLDDGHQ
jgi:hypothetical protein